MGNVTCIKSYQVKKIERQYMLYYIGYYTDEIEDINSKVRQKSRKSKVCKQQITRAE